MTCVSAWPLCIPAMMLNELPWLNLSSCVYMASSLHVEGWENSRQLCKPDTLSRVCITFENSPEAGFVRMFLGHMGVLGIMSKT